MISVIISAFIMVPITFYIWHYWLEEKYVLLSLKNLLFTLFTSCLVIINYLTVSPIIKMMDTLLIFIIVYKLIFNKTIKNSIAIPFVTEILFTIAEIIFASFMMAILNNGATDFINNYFGSIITNLSTSIIVLLFSRFKFIKRIIKKLNFILNNFNEIIIISVVSFILLCFSIFVVNSYSKLNSSLMMLFSLGIVLIVIIMFIVFIKTKEDYIKLNERYNNNLISLKELENSLINHRIDNHENKNHLLTIRNMTKNKKVTSFIDTILDNKLKDDNNLLHETSVIPTGGLRGLIYSKLLIMKNKGIDYELDVSNSIITLDMLIYDDETMLDICKIVGIFLDNAIEEMDNVDDKYIIVELYMEDNNIIISITNNYDNSFDKSNIKKSGVTTKGKNHGYGLSLVEKIIKRSTILSSKTIITENEFTQVLIIK